MNDKLRSLFGDLGKATLRGVRKCPRCGTYNGTRGLSCKNKACNLVFKEAGKIKFRKSANAIKIVTGSPTQLYSVKDKAEDQSAFVQLPLFHVVGNTPDSPEVTLITHTSPKCYAELCLREEVPNVADTDACSHIKAAISCGTEAEPLTLKNSVLNSLPISFEMKQEIWLLATETTGPLVQRISKNVMVVKCKMDDTHPLGFLHFTFFSIAKKQSSEYDFHCGCQPTKIFRSPSFSRHNRCVHFYACVCAFLSDPKLAKEFKDYLHLELSSNLNNEPPVILTVESPTKGDDQNETPPNGVSDVVPLSELAETSDIEENRPPKKKKKDDSVVQASTALLTLQDGNTPRVKIAPKKPPPIIQTLTAKKPSAPTQTEESTTVYSFQKWLSSVTERINQTMHFQFSGHPDPLVFHIPQEFFDCLQQRISTGSKKKRLPNKTTSFTRKDALPLGTFTKYTWHITNILLVKQIFDTPEMPLELTRSFVENFDGSYDVYEHSKDEMKGLAENFKKTNKSPLIKPLELKTILKVGNTSPDQKEPTPFIIEWIPNILPKSYVGELRIKFEYGHQRNGLFENQSSPKKAIRSHQPNT